MFALVGSNSVRVSSCHFMLFVHNQSEIACEYLVVSLKITSRSTEAFLEVWF